MDRVDSSAQRLANLLSQSWAWDVIALSVLLGAILFKAIGL